MYLFFRATTGITATKLPNYPALLRTHRFRRVAARRFFGRIVVSELWQRDGRDISG
jgi:hypothetical protein